METFHAIQLLDEAFRAHRLNYLFTESGRYQEIRVPFGIKNGPSVELRYISFNRHNDLTVMISNLVNDIPDSSRAGVLETCNELNRKFRFLKFSLDENSNLDVQHDFPENTGDECLGEMAFEIFLRTIRILGEAWPALGKTLYGQEEAKEDDGKQKDLMKILDENQDGINIRISKMEPSGSSDK